MSNPALKQLQRSYRLKRQVDRALVVIIALFVLCVIAATTMAATSQDPTPPPLPTWSTLEVTPELTPTPPATPVVLITIIPGATWEHYAGPHYVDPDGYTHYPDGGIIEITQGEVVIYVPMTPESSVKQSGADVILVDPEQDPEEV